MVTTAPVTTARTNIAARWARAAERAANEGVRVMQLPTSGVWIATSGTDATTAYVVTETACECHAGAHGDPVCKHRAALRVQLGQLAPVALAISPEPAPVAIPAAPAAAAPVAACTGCLGTGWARMYRSGRLSDYTEVPCGCTASHRAA